MDFTYEEEHWIHVINFEYSSQQGYEDLLVDFQ